MRIASLFSPWGKLPLNIAGAPRLKVVVTGPFGQTTRVSFSCSRDQLPGNSRSSLTKAREALKFAFSFRRSAVSIARDNPS